MKLAKFKQSPIENRRYFVDYSQWLDTNETLTGTPVFNVVEVTVPPLTVNSIAISSDNLGVVYFVSGGVDGEEYNVDLVVTTSGGQTREDSFTYIIDNPDD